MDPIVVLGGGLSGLVGASLLSQTGTKTVLLEREDRLGGLAASYLINGQHIPMTYHHVMDSDVATLSTIYKLGLGGKLYWKKLKVGFFSQGKFYDFSSSFSILRFKPIGFYGRIRFGMLVLRARQETDWSQLDGISVEAYCKKTSGKEAYKLVDYIVRAKFAESPGNVSAAWLMSRFGHESKSVSNQFGYLTGGVERIVAGLADCCRREGCLVKTGAKVTGIRTKDEGITNVEYEINGRTREIKTENVVSTLPLPVLLRIVDDLPQEYRRSLENIKYRSSICVTIAMKEKISPFYWLNVMNLERYPFAGVFEHGHLNSELRCPSVMFVVKYLDSMEEFWRKSDEEILEEFLPNLSDIFECDVAERLLWWRVHRARYSTPLFTPDYGKHMPDCISPIQGLYIGGISRTYPKDRYMGTALQTGEEAAEAALAHLK